MGGYRRGGAGVFPRRRRGHTLAELLVVMAIILMTIALCLPYYMKAIRMARGVAEGEETPRRRAAPRDRAARAEGWVVGRRSYQPSTGQAEG